MTDQPKKAVPTVAEKLKAEELDQSRRQLAIREKQASAGSISTTAGGALSFLPRGLPEVLELAEVMSMGGPAVGLACRENKGVCASVIMTALSWGMNPFTVSQHVYVTKSKGGAEKIAYEAQLINGVINSRARS